MQCGVKTEESLMKRTVMTTSLAFCLLLGAASALAQTVYQSRGDNGPVFSDKPQPGAKAVDLPPLNVIDSTVLTGGNTAEKNAAPAQPKAGGEPAGSKEAAVAYRSFSIVFPENDGSVVANTAQFEVRVAVDPALRLGEGHAITVSINGQPVVQRFTASEFTIPPEFWGDQLPAPNQRLQLGAAIVDRNGAVLKEAAPVQFYLRHATLLQHPRRPPPPPPPQSALPVSPARAAGQSAISRKLPTGPEIRSETPERAITR